MTAKAKLVKTKRAKVKRPRLWAVVWRDLDPSVGWHTGFVAESLAECEKRKANARWDSRERARIIEIPAAELE